MKKFNELRATVKVRCPLSKEAVSHDECYACQIEHLPHGCWDAENVMDLLDILINEQMWGAKATGGQAAMKRELMEKIEVIE